MVTFTRGFITMPSMINLLKTIFASNFGGMGNNQSQPFSVNVPSQSLPANGAVVYTAQLIMTKSTSISDVQIRYTGRDSLWYWMDGFQSFTDPSTNFTISSRVYIQGGVLFVRNQILDNTGLAQTLPAFTIDCKGFLYDAPF